MVVLWTTNTPGHRICIDYLKKLNVPIRVIFYPAELPADARTVFLLGTPKIRNLSGKKFLNFHGGDPEFYRGHDCLWWAILDRNLDAVVTTLHIATEELDGGPILAKHKIRSRLAKDIYRYNMENCAWLIWCYLNKLIEQESPQTMKGRMCKRMTAIEKQEAERIWDEEVQSVSK